MARRLLRRLRAEDGFGLIELSMAIVMLNVGILAIVAAFQAGAVTLRRANLVANATTIADQQMEAFRRMRNCEINLNASQMPAAGSDYANDTGAYAAAGSGASSNTNVIGSYFSSSRTADAQFWVTSYQPSSGQSTYWDLWESTFVPVGHSDDTRSGNGPRGPYPACTNGSAAAVTPSTTVTGPDNRTYRRDVYIYVVRVANQGWQKQVVVVVRDPANAANGHSLVRESSNFDPFDSP